MLNSGLAIYKRMKTHLICLEKLQNYLFVEFTFDQRHTIFFEGKQAHYEHEEFSLMSGSQAPEKTGRTKDMSTKRVRDIN